MSTPDNADTTDTTDTTDTAEPGTSAMPAPDKLWAALRARPVSTADELAADAGIGRSTAAKILARWLTDTSITRTAGARSNGRPTAATFAIAPTTDAHPTDSHATDASAPSTDASAPSTDASAPSTDASAVGDAYATDTADVEEAADTDEAADAETEPTADTATDQEARTATIGNHAERDATTETDKATTTTEPARGPAAIKGKRLAPGGLRGMIEDFLREHPGQDFGPAKIGTELGRSSGAVANALVKLAADGYATQTSDKPKRYTYTAQPAES